MNCVAVTIEQYIATARYFDDLCTKYLALREQLNPQTPNYPSYEELKAEWNEWGHSNAALLDAFQDICAKYLALREKFDLQPWVDALTSELAANDMLGRERDAFQRELEELRKDSAAVWTRGEERRIENKTLQANSERICLENCELRDNRDRLLREKHALCTENESLRSQVRVLQAEAKNDVRSPSQDWDDRAPIPSYEELRARLCRAGDVMIKYKRFDELSTAIEELGAERDEYKRDYEATAGERAEVEADRNYLQKQFKQLAVANEELRADRDNLRTLHANQARTIIALQQENADLRETWRIPNAENQQLRAERDELSAKYQAVLKAFSTIEIAASNDLRGTNATQA